MAKPIWIAALGLVVVFNTGCSKKDPEGTSASGTVLAGDTPLTGALITLEPIGATKGPNASAPVFGGQFEIGPDQGLLGGKYRVRLAMIPAELRSTIPKDSGYEIPPSNSVIDPSFDANSQLTCDLPPGINSELKFSVRFLK